MLDNYIPNGNIETYNTGIYQKLMLTVEYILQEDREGSFVSFLKNLDTNTEEWNEFEESIQSFILEYDLPHHEIVEGINTVYIKLPEFSF